MFTAGVGSFEQQNQSILVETGTIFRDVRELENLVVQVNKGRPVYLKDIATIIDGPAEPDSYSWIQFGPADPQAPKRTGQSPELHPAVHIAIAKRKGSNAVTVASNVEARLESLSESLLPAGVHYRITRDYGETANDKVNELVEGLAVAVITVIGLIGLTIGWRAALVVALAIPVCYSLTLAVNLLLGYTINRVTMFALILSLGLLVDDPITDVENIARYFSMRVAGARQSVLAAIQEVPAGIDHVDAGNHRQFPAVVVHHWHDGPIHGSDGIERSTHRNVIDDRRLSGDSVDGDGRHARTCSGESRASRPNSIPPAVPCTN